MSDRLLTPTKITAWLDCAHFLTLQHEVDSGARKRPARGFGEMATMLVQKGLDHEAALLDRYRAEGRTVFEVPPQDRDHGETFAAWADRVRPELDAGHDVIYQMPFVHDGIRGIADFLERTTALDGTVVYEPVDAKLARNAAKPGHLLQLCFYAEALAATTGQAPEHVHIELGSGARETVRVAEVLAYWHRLRGQLAKVVDETPTEATSPEPCDHCDFCDFEAICKKAWEDADSLVNVAGVRRIDRARLEADGTTTIAALAVLDHEVPDVDDVRRERMVRQAALQVQAKDLPEGSAPPFELLDATQPTDDGAETDDNAEPGPDGKLVGFAALPQPDDSDVFLDFEGHPFWKADAGLLFLFGLIEQDGAGEWIYRTYWAHDRAGERRATAQLVADLAERRRRHPGMHVYHYNHTERTSLVALTTAHVVAELELEELIATGLFVDLFPVVTGAVQVGVKSYGLKQIERLTTFERGHEIEKGSGAVIEYEHWLGDHDQARLDRIARYNEDDVRATLAVRDWLVAHRPADVVWRDAVLEPATVDEELDARIEALHDFGLGTPEHLLGDLLGYWRRERRVISAGCTRLSSATEDDQLAAFGAIAGLTFEGFEASFTAKGAKRKWEVGVFSFPTSQPIDPDIKAGSKMIVALTEQEWAFFPIDSIDRATGRLEISWNQERIDTGVTPTHLVHFPDFPEGAKQEALCDLADQALAGDTSAVGHAIVRNDPPRFTAGHGPADGVFVGDHQAICEWAPHLDSSFVPIQGPPGTGKTFTGSHVIRTLVQAGLRVGITAMSHHAIDNLLRAVEERYREAGDDSLRAVCKPRAGSDPEDRLGVTHKTDNGVCATGEYDVIAGTAWLFASEAMRDHPVDVLVIDEAGQLGLADTLAASTSARNVLLLGDPQQLPQVSQASHPNRSGVSALEHLLGEEHRTFSPDRGVLLDVTWRMHPDVCEFISDVMYESKLTSEPSCSVQTTSAGTGLRWIRADHQGRSTESAEEATIVADLVGGLIGTDWTDQKGVTRPLTVDDVIVVTPYNDQRRLLEGVLGARPSTAGVRVGTVDKFQGREASVVVFSMATSSADYLPRAADFLFSKNRLNVAISRARCLAYLVCTDALLDTRARTTEEMSLISALCSFVERADQIGR